MTTVDERVLAMKFDGKQFEAGATSALSMLDKIKKGLKLDGAAKGFAEVDKAAKNVSFSGMQSGIQGLQHHFNTLDVIATSVLKNITDQAFNAGQSLISSLTLKPIMEGFDDYNEKLTSVQTIMNATGADLPKVDSYFKELDTYADKTVYNLKDMTGAFAKFTNAGVGMDKSVPAIKGIANMVALAGQGAGAASIAMYNLSQSIAGGFLTTPDFKSLNLANVATSEWKNQMIAGAIAAGKLKKAADGTYKIVGSGSKKAYTEASLFNEALSEGWASADVLLDVLGDYGDATTEIGEKALAAAQNVKSLPMMMETIGASIGTGWTETFELLLGNVEESTALFTGLTNVIGGFVENLNASRNETIKVWKDLGGRTALIETFTNIYNGLLSVLGPIKDAFNEVFPATTGEQLANFTKMLQELTSHLKMGEKDSENLKRTFKGVLSIFSIAGQIIGMVAGKIGELFNLLPKGNLDFLSVAAGVGDMIVAFDQSLKSGEAVKQLMDKLREAVAFLGEVFNSSSIGEGLRKVVDSIQAAFTKVDFSGVTNAVSGVKKATGPLGDALAKIGAAISDLVDKAMPYLRKFADLVSQVFDVVKKKLSDVFSSLDGDTLMRGLNVGMLAGLGIMIGNFIKTLQGIAGEGKGFLGRITGIIDGVRDSFAALQASLKAKTLLMIAGSILMLAIALTILATIDPDKLAPALMSIVVLFGALTGTMSGLNAIMSKGGVADMIKIGAAMIILSVSVLILAFAVKQLAGLSWGDLIKGLGAVVILMGVLNSIAPVMSSNSKGLIKASLGMIVFGLALRILVGAVKDIGEMDLGVLVKGLASLTVVMSLLSNFLKATGQSKFSPATAIGLILVVVAIKLLLGVIKDFAAVDTGALAKGMISVGLVLTGLAMFTRMVNTNKMLETAAGMVVLAFAVAKLQKNIQAFADMSWGELFKGLLGLSATMLILATASKAMTEKKIGGMLNMAFALGIIALSMKLMASMSLGEIAKSLIALAGALTIMAFAVNLMPKDARGAGSLIVMALAISVLVPALKALGDMSIGQVVTSLVMLAGVFTILGVAGYLLGPVAPMIMLLAGAIALLGLGALLAGVGITMLAAGFAALALSAVAGATALVAAVAIILQIIPVVMAAIGAGIIAFAAVIANGGPAITAAITVVLLAIITAIQVVTPRIINALWIMIMAMWDKLVENVPKLVDGGMRMIAGILKGIADNIGKVVDEGARVIVEFLNGIARNLNDVVQAGVNLIITLVESLAAAVRNNKNRMSDAGLDLAGAIVDGLVSGLGNLAKRVADAAWALGKKAIDAIAGATKTASPSKEARWIGEYVGDGFADGMDNRGMRVTKAGENLGNSALTALRSAMETAANIAYGEIDTQPTIRPVLDLSGVTSGAKSLSNLFSSPVIDVRSAYSSALAARPIAAPNDASSLTNGTTDNSSVVQFTQNNYSPKALSRVDIYRQTKNQLSTLKGALP